MPNNVDGLITRPCSYDYGESVNRLETAIHGRGLTLFARIDHSALAAEVGLSLRPTLLVLFGSPRAGTPLMQESQTIGIDLPMKILVWTDEQFVTQVSYNDPAWLAERHNVTNKTEVVHTMSLLMNEILAETIAQS